MKRCPICGNQYNQGTVCPMCGILLIDTETNSAVAAEPAKKSRFSVKKKNEMPVEETVLTEPSVENIRFEEPEAEMPVIEDVEIEDVKIEDPVIERPAEKKTIKVQEQEEDIYGLGVKTERNPVQQSQGQGVKNSKSNDGKITISFHPAYAVAVVVAILLIVAIVFMVRGFKAKKEAEEMYQAMQQTTVEENIETEGLTDEEIAAQTGMASENVDETDLAVKAEDTAIHSYQIVISDESWVQAFEECESRGGYLVRINSAEEYNYILNMLDNGDYSKYHFYLGGRRDVDGRGYFWVDENNVFMGELLNGPNSWTNGYWFPNEPSFEDTGSDASGRIQENVMNLFCVKGTWYLNDSSDDMAFYYPELLGGKVGYIVEYE